MIVKYYSTSYFGIKQARDIDALRYAIEEKGGAARSVYLAALFYAMKESVLSKDGHMAQPLDLKKIKIDCSGYEIRIYVHFLYKRWMSFVVIVL